MHAWVASARRAGRPPLSHVDDCKALRFLERGCVYLMEPVLGRLGARTLAAGAPGLSITIARGGLSERSPLKEGCLTFPSGVHSENATSAIISGRTHWALRLSGPLGQG